MNDCIFLRNVGYDNSKRKLAVFECYCGNEWTTIKSYVETGKIKSCGCYQIEKGNQITYQGKTQSLYAWSEETGINLDTLTYRLKVGKPFDEVFRTNKKENDQ